MSPTAPTFVTLNNQLTKAHRRIRELEARETELVAHNRILCAAIEGLTEEHPRRAADVTSSLDNGGARRLVATINRTGQRTASTASSTLVTSGRDRQLALPRK
jgi:predicted transcriptional regulator